MDALCLLSAGSYDITGVNASWTRLFGYSSERALHTTLAELAVAPEEILASARSAESKGSESSGRALFQRADRSRFVADYSIGPHEVGATRFMTLLLEEVAIGAFGSAMPAPGPPSERTPESSAPTRMHAAMRDRVARSARQQSALLRLASEEDEDFEKLMKRILRVDAETLDVARVSYWTLSPTGDSIVCEALFDTRRGGFESGVELFARDYSTYFRALVTGTLVPAHDAITDPRTHELEPYLRPLGIGALLDIPVFLRGELVGVVCHEHVGPARGWTLDEQQFALSIGQTFSLALAARTREEATRSLRQRDVMLAEANAIADRATRPDDGPLTGQTMGKYLMGQLIGRGGMGEVYRAMRTEDGSEVAIKLLKAGFLDRPEQVQRFFREARVTAAVPSEHVARVYDVGTFDSGVPYIAMEVLEGHDLGWHLRRNPQLPIEQVVELCDHAARALAAVREAGVVHRDLKPSNLFLVDALPRAWKVLDFGLSRSLADPFTTTADDIVGTPAYMAPEQVSGDPIDHRTDLYALASIAYRALTGRPPFAGELPQILYAVLREAPPPVSSLARGVPVDVELVLTIAMSKDPTERFPDVESFAEALRTAASGQLSDILRAHGWRLLKRNAALASET